MNDMPNEYIVLVTLHAHREQMERERHRGSDGRLFMAHQPIHHVRGSIGRLYRFTWSWIATAIITMMSVTKLISTGGNVAN